MNKLQIEDLAHKIAEVVAADLSIFMQHPEWTAPQREEHVRELLTRYDQTFFTDAKRPERTKKK